MTSAAELAILRNQTAGYIAANPTSMIFTRETKVDDGAGGHTTTSSPLAPQVVRVIQQNRAMASEDRNRDGETVRPNIVVQAAFDANIRVDDTFEWEGLHCEVTWITDLGYELLCEVEVH